MDRRLQLHNILLGIVDNVYFQPPTTKKLEFPCIVYRRSDVDTKYADDNQYISRKLYQVTIIDANPDSLLPSLVAKLPSCSFDRFFTKDNLNHDNYNLYF